MPQAAVTAPMGIYIMRIGIVDDRQTIFEDINITTGQSDGYLAGTIRTGGIQHHIAAVRFI